MAVPLHHAQGFLYIDIYQPSLINIPAASQRQQLNIFIRFNAAGFKQLAFNRAALLQMGMLDHEKLGLARLCIIRC